MVGRGERRQHGGPVGHVQGDGAEDFLTRDDALIELYDTVCYGAATVADPRERRCGNAKLKGRSFCYFCWQSLPMHMKRLLNNKKGYANVITKCKEQLATKRAAVLTVSDDADDRDGQTARG